MQTFSREQVDEIQDRIKKLFDGVMSTMPLRTTPPESFDIQQKNNRRKHRRRKENAPSEQNESSKIPPVPRRRTRVAICKAHKRGRMVRFSLKDQLFYFL